MQSPTAIVGIFVWGRVYMKKLSVLAAAVLLVSMAGSTCFAGVSAGETAVSISGSLASNKPDGGDSTTTTTIISGLNYFLRDDVSVGAQLVYFGYKGSGFKSNTAIINGAAKYHFTPKNIAVPYVGIMAGYSMTDSGSGTQSGYDYGAMAGVNYFLMENASIDAELNYRKDVQKESGKDFKSSTTTFLVGLTYYFGK